MRTFSMKSVQIAEEINNFPMLENTFVINADPVYFRVTFSIYMLIMVSITAIHVFSWTEKCGIYTPRLKSGSEK